MQHTGNRLAEVPMMNPVSSKPFTQAVELSGTPLVRWVPANDMLTMADKFGSQDPNSIGVIWNVNTRETTLCGMCAV